jgi:hypothetical protein
MSEAFEVELPQLSNALLPLHSQVAAMKDCLIPRVIQIQRYHVSNTNIKLHQHTINTLLIFVTQIVWYYLCNLF